MTPTPEAITPGQIVTIIAVLLPIFIGTNPTEQEIVAFLTAIVPALSGGSGTIPAIKAGNVWIGPIPYGPSQPAQSV
jgi:hypothetical protein